MAPQFRWRRIDRILTEDPTALVEVILAVFFILIPGVAQASGHSDMPALSEWYFFKLGFTEDVIGCYLITFAILQLWGAGTEWYRVRAAIAFVIGVALIGMVNAYVLAGYGERQTVYNMIGVILAEGFVSFRCLVERPRGVGPFDPSPPPGQTHA